MASFKLCYYGDGRAVTIPLAWIIKSEREVEGSRAQRTQLLCSLRLEEEPRGRNNLLQLVFTGRRSLSAGAIKEAGEMGAGEGSKVVACDRADRAVY